MEGRRLLLEQMSDEDLIFLMKSGSELAEKAMYRRYNEYSRHEAKTYFNSFKDSGITIDEFFAVAFSKVHEAIKKYETINVCFYVFWKQIAKNAIYDYIRENSYQLGAKAFGTLSLDDNCYDDNDVLLFSDVLGENETRNTLKDTLDTYIYGDNQYLSSDEKLIADLFYIQERSRKEIVEITKLGKNRVNYLIRTTKQKIQTLIKENNL